MADLHALPTDILIAIVEYCDVRTIAALLSASPICWRLPFIPHCFGAKRNVVIALDRIRSERLFSPYHYDAVGNRDMRGWDMTQQNVQVPGGRFYEFPSPCIEEIDIVLSYKSDSYGGIVFNQKCHRRGFFLFALHSNEVMFTKGYGHRWCTDAINALINERGDLRWHPPRGRLPTGRKWNYTLGGYLPI